MHCRFLPAADRRAERSGVEKPVEELARQMRTQLDLRTKAVYAARFLTRNPTLTLPFKKGREQARRHARMLSGIHHHQKMDSRQERAGMTPNW